MRRFRSLLAALFLGTVLIAQNARPANLADAVDRVRNCVVRVEADFPGGKASLGTGFFVNKEGVVVTANHVIHPPGVPDSPQTVTINLRVATVRAPNLMMNNWKGSRASVVDVDATHDIVVLKVDEGVNPFTHPQSGFSSLSGPVLLKTSVCAINERLLRDGEPVFTSGYPLDLLNLITTSGAIASSDPANVDLIDREVTVRDAYWVDMQVNQGNSGGPVFSLSSGEVIGIAQAYNNAPATFANSSDKALGVSPLPNGSVSVRPIEYNSGIGILVPSRYVGELLRKNKINFTTHKRHP